MSEIDKRQVILDSAFQVFMKKGFHNAKMADVAENAGIGKGTIYEYFDSKKSLFEESFINNLELGYNDIRSIFESDICFKDKLTNYLKFKYNYLSVQSSLAENFLAHGELVSKRIKDSFMLYMAKYYNHLNLLVEQGIREMVLKDEVDAEIMVSCIMGISNNYLGIKVLFKKENEIDYEKIINSLLCGFGK
ncbi:MAG: TetR/AcrR family transcriptional regulator [Eubacteriales bacterium]|nr:TetR/AcrR family transcriptional regulator [Eubacteriales bacterium]